MAGRTNTLIDLSEFVVRDNGWDDHAWGGDLVEKQEFEPFFTYQGEINHPLLGLLPTPNRPSRPWDLETWPLGQVGQTGIEALNEPGVSAATPVASTPLPEDQEPFAFPLSPLPDITGKNNQPRSGAFKDDYSQPGSFKRFQFKNLLPADSGTGNARTGKDLLNTFLGDTFDRWLTPPDYETAAGFIGKESALAIDPLTGDRIEHFINERTEFRQDNQIQVGLFLDIDGEHTNTSWQELLDQMRLTGLDTNDQTDCLFATRRYSYQPPVNPDKFVNHNSYIWIEYLQNGTAASNFEPISGVSGSIFNFAPGTITINTRNLTVSGVSTSASFNRGDILRIRGETLTVSAIINPSTIALEEVYQGLEGSATQVPIGLNTALYHVQEQGSFIDNGWTQNNFWLHVDDLTSEETTLLVEKTYFRGQLPIIALESDVVSTGSFDRGTAPKVKMWPLEYIDTSSTSLPSNVEFDNGVGDFDIIGFDLDFDYKFSIIAASDTGHFFVDGDVVSTFLIAAQFNVTESGSGNDGLYTISASGASFASSTALTKIPVDEAVADGGGGNILSSSSTEIGFDNEDETGVLKQGIIPSFTQAVLGYTISETNLDESDTQFSEILGIRAQRTGSVVGAAYVLTNGLVDTFYTDFPRKGRLLAYATQITAGENLLRSMWEPTKVMEVTPTQNSEGEWNVAENFKNNIQKENPETFTTNQILDHFRDVLITSASAAEDIFRDGRNWRNHPDAQLGNGGTIFQYEHNLDWWAALMFQQDSDPQVVLEFARGEHLRRNNSIRGIIERISTNLTNRSIVLTQSQFRVLVLEELRTLIEGVVPNAFFDSTNGLPNFIATPAHFGLFLAEIPGFVYDHTTGKLRYRGILGEIFDLPFGTTQPDTLDLIYHDIQVYLFDSVPTRFRRTALDPNLDRVGNWDAVNLTIFSGDGSTGTFTLPQEIEGAGQEFLSVVINPTDYTWGRAIVEFIPGASTDLYSLEINDKFISVIQGSVTTGAEIAAAIISETKHAIDDVTVPSIVKVVGDKVLSFVPGKFVEIVNSTNNDGSFEIQSAVLSGPDTLVTLLSGSNLDDSIIDGSIAIIPELNIQSFLDGMTMEVISRSATDVLRVDSFTIDIIAEAGTPTTVHPPVVAGASNIIAADLWTTVATNIQVNEVPTPIGGSIMVVDDDFILTHDHRTLAFSLKSIPASGINNIAVVEFAFSRKYGGEQPPTTRFKVTPGKLIFDIDDYTFFSPEEETSIRCYSASTVEAEGEVRFLKWAQRRTGGFIQEFSEPFTNVLASNDPFTWNYRDDPAQIPAYWWDIYEKFFGTSGPHYEPWTVQGYPEKPGWWETDFPRDEDGLYPHSEMWQKIQDGEIQTGHLGIGILTAAEDPKSQIVKIEIPSGAGFVDTADPASYWRLFSTPFPPLTEYYAWYSAGDAIDPSASGTGIEISASIVDSASAVALRTASVINALTDFTAFASGTTATITNVGTGPANDPVDVNAGISVSVLQSGTNPTDGGVLTPARALPINFNTGSVLPPFSSALDSTFVIEPAGKFDDFVFGDNAPAEKTWRDTLDFRWDTVEIGYTLKPIDFISLTWDSERLLEWKNAYTFDQATGRKTNHQNMIFFGEEEDLIATERNFTNFLYCSRGPIGATQQITEVRMPDGSDLVTASATDAQYWQLFSPDDDFYLWYAGGSSIDPVASGTGIQVIASTVDTSAEIASATVTAINTLALDNFSASVSGAEDSIVIIINASAGTVDPAVDFSASVSIDVTTTGSSGEAGRTFGGQSFVFGTPEEFDGNGEQKSFVLERGFNTGDFSLVQVGASILEGPGTVIAGSSVGGDYSFVSAQEILFAVIPGAGVSFIGNEWDCSIDAAAEASVIGILTNETADSGSFTTHFAANSFNIVASATGDAEITEITVTADGAEFTASGTAEYWTLSTVGTLFYVWYNITGGSGVSVDPAPGGTGIEINIAALNSSAAVAAETASVLNADAAFTASATDTVVTVTTVALGSVLEATEATATGLVDITVLRHGPEPDAYVSYNFEASPLTIGASNAQIFISGVLVDSADLTIFNSSNVAIACSVGASATAIVDIRIGAFEIAGDHADDFLSGIFGASSDAGGGIEFTVTSTSANDADYVVGPLDAAYNASADTTVIPVLGSVVSASISGLITYSDSCTTDYDWDVVGWDDQFIGDPVPIKIKLGSPAENLLVDNNDVLEAYIQDGDTRLQLSPSSFSVDLTTGLITLDDFLPEFTIINFLVYNPLSIREKADVVRTPKRINGINQWYTQFYKARGKEVEVGTEYDLHWRSWNPRAIYRTDHILNADGVISQALSTLMEVNTDFRSEIDRTRGIRDFYVDALQASIISKTETSTDTNGSAPNTTIWEIDNFDSRRNSITTAIAREDKTYLFSSSAITSSQILEGSTITFSGSDLNGSVLAFRDRDRTSVVLDGSVFLQHLSNLREQKITLGASALTVVATQSLITDTLQEGASSLTFVPGDVDSGVLDAVTRAEGTWTASGSTVQIGDILTITGTLNVGSFTVASVLEDTIFVSIGSFSPGIGVSALGTSAIVDRNLRTQILVEPPIKEVFSQSTDSEFITGVLIQDDIPTNTFVKGTVEPTKYIQPLEFQSDSRENLATKEIILPVRFTGAQEVFTFLSEYERFLLEQGAIFDFPNTEGKEDLGEFNDWPLQRKRFIRFVDRLEFYFNDPTQKTQFLKLNPIDVIARVGTTTGLVAPLETNSDFFSKKSQAILDINGFLVGPRKTQVLRNDNVTTVEVIPGSTTRRFFKNNDQFTPKFMQSVDPLAQGKLVLNGEIWFNTISEEFFSYDSEGNIFIPSSTAEDVKFTAIIEPLTIHTIHWVIDSYEHLIRFENETSTGRRIYDPLTGRSIDRLHLEFERSRNHSGRPSLGGFILNRDADNNLVVTRNIEAQIQGHRDLYDVYRVPSDNKFDTAIPETIGLESTSYLDGLIGGTSRRTQIGFYQGLIQQKGARDNINAYTKGIRSLKSFVLEEIFAYKVGEFGEKQGDDFVKVKIEENEGNRSILGLHFTDVSLLEPFDNQLIEIKENDPDRYTNLLDKDSTSDTFRFYFPATEEESKFAWWEQDHVQIIRDQNGNTFSGIVGDFASAVSTTSTLFDVNSSTITTGSGVVAGSSFFGVDFGQKGPGGFIEDHVIAGITIMQGTQAASQVQVQYTTASTTDLAASAMTWVNLGSPINVSGVDGRSDKVILPVHTTSARFWRVVATEISSPNWEVRNLEFHKYRPLADYDKIGKVGAFNNKTSSKVASWYPWDPAEGVHPPSVNQYIDNDTTIDPALYNIAGSATTSQARLDTDRAWGEEHIGETWWDKSVWDTIDYKDGRNFSTDTQRAQAWGKLSHGKKVAIYEWVRSDFTPAVWRVSAGLDGTVRNITDYTRDIVVQNDGTQKIFYYFWVTNRTTKGFTKQGALRNLTISQIAAGLEDPNTLTDNKHYHVDTFQASSISSGEGGWDGAEWDFSGWDINIGIIPDRFTKWFGNRGDLVFTNNNIELQFERHFLLTGNPKSDGGLLGVRHEEWELIRRNQNARPPIALWDEIVSTAKNSQCEFIPGVDNAKNNSDCIMDQGDLLRILNKRIPEIKLDFIPEGFEAISPISENSTPTFESGTPFDGAVTPTLDASSVDGNRDIRALGEPIKVFLTTDTPENTEKLLGRDSSFSFWNVASANAVTELFFDVLDAILAGDRERTDIFKTSWVSFDVEKELLQDAEFIEANADINLALEFLTKASKPFHTQINEEFSRTAFTISENMLVAIADIVPLMASNIAIPGSPILSTYSDFLTVSFRENSGSGIVPDVKEVTEITMPSGINLATSASASYWRLNAPGQDFYVWYSAGTSVDPVAGGIGIEVNASVTGSAGLSTVMASNTAVAIGSVISSVSGTPVGQSTNYFLTAASDAVVTITNVVGGSVLDAFDVDVGVVIDVLTQGIDTEMPALIAASLIYTEEFTASVEESIRISICHPVPGANAASSYGFYVIHDGTEILQPGLPPTVLGGSSGGPYDPPTTTHEILVIEGDDFSPLSGTNSGAGGIFSDVWSFAGATQGGVDTTASGLSASVAQVFIGSAAATESTLEFVASGLYEVLNASEIEIDASSSLIVQLRTGNFRVGRATGAGMDPSSETWYRFDGESFASNGHGYWWEGIGRTTGVAIPANSVSSVDKEAVRTFVTSLVMASCGEVLTLPEITEITTPTGAAFETASATNADYWTLFSTSRDNNQEYYVWYAAGSSIDPTATGIGIEVNASTTDTNTQVAIATASAINALEAFEAIQDGAVVTIRTLHTGSAQNAANVDAGVTVNVTQEGSN